MRWLFSMVILIILNSSVNITVENGQDAQSATVADHNCMLEADISSAVQRLSSPLSDPELTQVRNVLFNDAARSRRCRQQVIATLMKAMDKPNLNLFWDRASYLYWSYGAQLLGQLKATEALDLLIAHLTSTDGRSPNMNHFPAVGGIITMGPIALPKLGAALRHNPNPSLRTYAIFCIASIGGPSAKRTLRQALNFEKDPCNRLFIEASLEAFRNRRTPNRIIFDPERSKWYAAFECGGQ